MHCSLVGGTLLCKQLQNSKIWGTKRYCTLTDTTISQIDFIGFQTAKQQFSKLAMLDLMMTEYYAMWLEDRLFQFHTMDATSRYSKLLKDQPHIIQNIPLTYIASYLGVSLETLSRIRAKK